MDNRIVTVVGAGLAGSEAAWQIAKAGISVKLCEMRPKVMTKAHKTGLFAELVCSNSFRGADLSNAVGLLKEELRALDSLFIESALLAQVPAGGALAVDRDIFSSYIDSKLRSHPLVTVCEGEIEELPIATERNPVIIATGPLTSPKLSTAIEQLTGKGSLAFYDAISPIILDDSIDKTKVFRQSRYDKGTGSDYLNIPLNKEEYYRFVDEVFRGEKYQAHSEVENELDGNLRPFEGCMPIEDMVLRGADTLLFGPLKPTGLVNPVTGTRPYAVVQLRQDNKEATLWSMVGMQTRLKQGEQTRIFRMLPGLENAEFVRLGTVHRNTFIDSPRCLDATLQFRNKPGLFFAGQITGVEGYVESTAGGFLAGWNAARCARGEELATFPVTTAIGALMHYTSDADRKDFQPMNISFGLMPNYADATKHIPGTKKLGKKERRTKVSQAALQEIEIFIAANG